VAVFDPGSELRADLAFRLMVNTPVTLYWRQELLQQAISWLDLNGYQVVRLDVSSCEHEPDLHAVIAAGLDFPDYYGRNLNAFNDCMRDVVAGRYGWASNVTGLVLVLVAYDTFARSRPQPAQAVLDIIAAQSRNALLFGRRLICLVQSRDPQISFEPVGALPVVWNDAEWLNSRRQ
jgi:hypothetical protein